MAPNNEQQPHYDTHRYAGDQAADTRRVMNHMPDEDRSTKQEIQQSINASQAAELAPAVRMGDDRAIGDTPFWDSFTSKQLYDFATQNNSPTTADTLGRAFNDGGNNLAEAANALFEAVNALDGAWSGVAADSAKGALSPLAQAAGVAGQTAQMMGVQMSKQSLAATEVRKMPPAEEFNQQQALNAMVTGGPAAMQLDMKAQKDAADAVKREQIAYLTAYTQSLSAVDEATPSFVPPKETIGGGGGSNNNITGGTVSIPGTGDSVFNRGTHTGAPSGGYVGGIGAPGADQGFFDNDGSTDQSGFNPVPSGIGTGTSGYNPGPTTPSPTTFGPGGGGPSTAVPGAGAGGFGGGFGSFGGGAGGAGGPGAGAGGAGNPGATGPKGMTPGGMAPAGGGRGGAGGMGGVPRGKGDKEDDQEHGRPAYLVEGDPESTFGDDQLTAPAVIGGDDE